MCIVVAVRGVFLCVCVCVCVCVYESYVPKEVRFVSVQVSYVCK